MSNAAAEILTKTTTSETEDRPTDQPMLETLMSSPSGSDEATLAARREQIGQIYHRERYARQEATIRTSLQDGWLYIDSDHLVLAQIFRKAEEVQEIENIHILDSILTKMITINKYCLLQKMEFLSPARITPLDRRCIIRPCDEFSDDDMVALDGTELALMTAEAGNEPILTVCFARPSSAVHRPGTQPMTRDRLTSLLQRIAFTFNRYSERARFLHDHASDRQSTLRAENVIQRHLFGDKPRYGRLKTKDAVLACERASGSKIVELELEPIYIPYDEASKVAPVVSTAHRCITAGENEMYSGVLKRPRTGWQETEFL